VPNKTIYVSDDDLPLFERAQELAGANLSAAIVRALRRFIELEEAKQRGLEEITVIVNGPGAHGRKTGIKDHIRAKAGGTVSEQGAHRRKRFLGYRLVRWLQPTADGKGTEILNVYRTAGNRYALHTRSIPDWPLSGGDPDIAGDPKNWSVGSGFLQRLMTWGYDWEAFKESGDYWLQVFDTLEELKPHVSNDLYRAVSQAMEEPEIEELDI
jgi:EXLDI family protein